MSRTIAVGIDIGTHHIKVVAAEYPEGRERSLPRIIGTGFSESRGLRHGYIINQNEIVRSIREAVKQAEKTAGIQIKKAFLAVGGTGLGAYTTQASVIISRADSEIGDGEVTKATEACEAELPTTYMLNRKVLHHVPLGYKIDGKIVMGRPQGMKGMKLEARMLFVTCLEQHLNDFVEAINAAGIEVEDVMAAPLAASLVTLTKAQKIAGCVLANIGAETVSIVIFENDIPISLEVFPIGGIDITHDVALGLKIPLEHAEDLKKGKIDASIPKKKLDDIVAARLSDIFELIEEHLKKIGRSGLLPAGIILTGGSSNIHTIEDIARLSLRIPSRTTKTLFEGNEKNSVKDSFWAVAYGLCLLGTSSTGGSLSPGRKLSRQVWRRFVEWIKQFLP